MDEQPSASGLSFEAVTADLRRDNQDLSSYAGYLLRALYDALPGELVTADFARSLADKLRGRPGRLVGVTVTLGERRFLLARPALGARPEARIGHVSGGITLSTRAVPLDEWTAELGGALLGTSDLDTRAAAALHRLVVGGQLEQ
jgi:hypothetical protein